MIGLTSPELAHLSTLRHFCETLSNIFELILIVCTASVHANRKVLRLFVVSDAEGENFWEMA